MMKEKIHSILLERCKVFIDRSYFENKRIEKTPYKSLMPKNDVNILNYEAALDFTFNPSEKIRNIALMGAYGSGKSSIINTYEKKHPSKKFLHISLAHFHDSLGENNTDEGQISENKISNLLEGKILNQLIHQIDPNRIIETNFNIKRPQKRKSKIYKIIAYSFLVFSILYYLLYSKWAPLVRKIDSAVLHCTLSPYFKLGLIIICSFILLGSIIAIINHKGCLKHLKKLEFKNLVGIEIFDSSTESYFDKYLNEVIYLFQNCGAEAIVFEDLDRYETTLIFEKLREINYLVNHSLHENVIRFFYLIRDDIFATSDRSKFFDFIIPVIPVVDITNASDMLSQLLLEANLKDEIDDHLIQDLSFYINDMRLLVNIVNEYEIYKKTIKEIAGCDNANHQFSMIVYKNLFPEDFHALQAGHGFLYMVFKHKEDTAEAESARLEAQVIEKRAIIKDIETQFIRNVDELNALYFPFNKEVSSIDGEEIDENVGRTELIRNILKSQEIVEYREGSHFESLDVDECLSIMKADAEYCVRYAKLKTLESNSIETLNQSIDKLNKEIKLISTRRLKELLVSSGEAAFWKCVEESYGKERKYTTSVVKDRNYGLIKHLIKSGYIDEDYSVYSSYIYSKDLSPNDRSFILSVYNGKALKYEYKLNDPERVLELLNPSSFLLKWVNNYDLLNCAIVVRQRDLLETWFDTIENSGIEGHNFILSFWKTDESNEGLIQIINELCPHWLKIWMSQNLMSDTDFVKFVLDTVKVCDSSTLASLNTGNWLAEKISLNKQFLECFPDNLHQYCEALKHLNIKFINLQNQNNNQRIIKYVYENDLYKLNLANIKFVMSSFYSINFNLQQSTIFSVVLRNKEKHFSKYALANIDEIFQIILDSTKKRYRDKSAVVVELLNDSRIAESNIVRYVDNLMSKVRDIQRVNNRTFWRLLLEKNNVRNSFRNLLLYFKEIENGDISELLANNLKDAIEPSILRFDKMNNLLSIDVATKFRIAFVKSKLFEATDYERILKYMGFVFNEFTIKELSGWQLMILIKNNIVAKTVKNFDLIKLNYEEYLLDFVFEGDSKKVFDLIENNSISLSKTEILDLLSDGRINDASSLILLDLYDGNISVEGKRYSDVVMEDILLYHFSAEDLPWLFENFERLGDKSKAAIKQYTTTNYSRVLTAAITTKSLPAEIYAHFISLDIFDVTRIKELRKYLKDRRFEFLCTAGKSPSFENLEHNRIILNYFKKQGWISSYSETEKRIRAYAKRKSKALV